MHVMKTIIVISTLIFFLCPAHASVNGNKDSLLLLRKQRAFKVTDRAFTVFDVKTPAKDVEKLLFPIHNHPIYDSVWTPDIQAQLLKDIKTRVQSLGKDSLLTADLFYVLRPYFSWLQQIDPHCRIEEIVPLDHSQFKNIQQAERQLFVPGFMMLNINDTLVISQSIDSTFMIGDRVCKINNVEASDYLKYVYNDRYVSPMNLLKNFFFNHITSNFNIQLERNKKVITVQTNGIPYTKATLQLSQQHQFKIEVFDRYKVGYIIIDKFFPNNSLLVNKISKAIQAFKSQGITDVVLDLRANPGGSGHYFDKLLSIFINKSYIPYIKEQKLKVSNHTISDYDFLTDDMIGKVIDIPDQYLVKNIHLDAKMYIPDMHYYILMSKDTGSIAASFCNILQYNNAAQLVGEALLKNALCFGEVIPGEEILPTLLKIESISTTEIDEYTKAVDGILMPDIAIPYVAHDYLTGRDAMLDKLLEVIKSNRDN